MFVMVGKKLVWGPVFGCHYKGLADLVSYKLCHVQS